MENVYIVYVCEHQLNSIPVRIIAKCKSLAERLHKDLSKLGYIVSIQFGPYPQRTEKEIEMARQYVEEAMSISYT